jgi:hypothetical protein
MKKNFNDITNFWLFNDLLHLKSRDITAVDIFCCNNDQDFKYTYMLCTTVDNDVYAARMEWSDRKTKVDGMLLVRKISELCGKRFRCLSTSPYFNVLITVEGDVYG